MKLTPDRVGLARALCDAEQTLRSQPYGADVPFWQLAAADGVELLLIDAARRRGGEIAWPDAARDAARLRLLQAAALQAARERELSRLLARLSDGGVRCLVIKGAAVAHSDYSDPALRRRDDADLLIRREDVAAAIGVIEGAGYVRDLEPPNEIASLQAHFDRPAPICGIYGLDLHWGIANRHALANVLPFDVLAAGAVPVPALGSSAMAPGPAQGLLVACVHWVAHHQGAPRLVWLWDIHLLATRLTDEQRTAFVELIRRTGMSGICRRGLALAAEAFDDEATASVCAALDNGLEARGEQDLDKLLDRRPTEADWLISDLAALPSWKLRLALVREHVFPSRVYMSAAYPRWPPVLMPLAYVWRTCLGAGRWFRRT